MKYLCIILFSLLIACHPTFNKEHAKELLETKFSNVQLMDYYEYPNCSTAHTYATAWKAKNESDKTVTGVLCCERTFAEQKVSLDKTMSCLVFEMK